MGFFSRLFGKSKSKIETRRDDDYPIALGPRLPSLGRTDAQQDATESGPGDDGRPGSTQIPLSPES